MLKVQISLKISACVPRQKLLCLSKKKMATVSIFVLYLVFKLAIGGRLSADLSLGLVVFQAVCQREGDWRDGAETNRTLL